MRLIRNPPSIAGLDPTLPKIRIRVDRLKLAKRLWRAAAEDGVEFGFDVETPLEDGDVVWMTGAACYIISQTAEPVLEIPLDPRPEAAAVLGWVVGNMHFVIEAREDRILTPDDPALRQTFDRAGISFRATSAVFRPHRLARVVGHSHLPAQENPFLRPIGHAQRAV